MVFALVLPQPRHTEHLAHIRVPCKIKEWESVERELRNSKEEEFNEGGLQVEGCSLMKGQSPSGEEVFESGFLRVRAAFLFPLESLEPCCLWRVTAMCCVQLVESNWLCSPQVSA